MAVQHGKHAYSKSIIRKRLLKEADDGWAYVPFIGDGDLASEFYPDRNVLGVDLDPSRVETAKGRIKGDAVVSDCDSFRGFGDRIFSVADCDAWCYPYQSFESFWKNAIKTDRVVAFFTDGSHQTIQRNGSVVMPDGEKVSGMSVNERRKMKTKWWKIVKGWTEDVVRPYRITRTKKVIQTVAGWGMVYWGCVIEP